MQKEPFSYFLRALRVLRGKKKGARLRGSLTHDLTSLPHPLLRQGLISTTKDTESTKVRSEGHSNRVIDWATRNFTCLSEHDTDEQKRRRSINEERLSKESISEFLRALRVLPGKAIGSDLIRSVTHDLTSLPQPLLRQGLISTTKDTESTKVRSEGHSNRVIDWATRNFTCLSEHDTDEQKRRRSINEERLSKEPFSEFLRFFVPSCASCASW